MKPSDLTKIIKPEHLRNLVKGLRDIFDDKSQRNLDRLLKFADALEQFEKEEQEEKQTVTLRIPMHTTEQLRKIADFIDSISPEPKKP